jgi:hypothetical protein
MLIEAIIHGNGTYYSDGVERLYLHFRKSDAHGLPCEDGVKTPIQLEARGHTYTGQINGRADYPYLFLSPELTDELGEAHKCAYLFGEWGLVKAGRVRASVDGTRIELMI